MIRFRTKTFVLVQSSHHLPRASDICAERLQSQKGVGLWNIPVNLDTRGEVMLIFLQTSIDRFQKEKKIDISPATCFWYMQRGSCLLISIDSSKKWPCWKSAFLCRISCFILYLSPIWIHSLHSFPHLHSHWSRNCLWAAVSSFFWYTCIAILTFFLQNWQLTTIFTIQTIAFAILTIEKTILVTFEKFW